MILLEFAAKVNNAFNFDPANRQKLRLLLLYLTNLCILQASLTCSHLCMSGITKETKTD